MFCSLADLQNPQFELDGKACAAVGQSSLMALYDTLFSQVKKNMISSLAYFAFGSLFFFFFNVSLALIWYSIFMQLDVTSSQHLVTDNDFRNVSFRKQLSETVKSLLALKVVPIFNENDAVSTRRAPYEVYNFFPLIWFFVVVVVHSLIASSAC